MSLLEVLSDRYVVSRNRLLSFLALNDLLRLRRVSKPFKHAAEDFIRTKKVKTSRMFFIDFKTARPFEQYFKFQDTSSFLPQREELFMVDYIHSRANSFSTKKLLQSFLSTCGATNLKSLTIQAIQGCVIPLHSKRWIQFLDSFPNLTHLDLRDFVPFDVDVDEDLFASSGRTSTPQEVTIPTGFRKLQHLKLGPLYLNSASLAAKQTTFAFCVKFVENYICNLERLFVPFDTFLLNDWGVERNEVMRFVSTCLFNDHNVKLEDVGGELIEELLQMDGRIPEMGTIEDIENRINSKVVSVYCPDFKTFFQELPNLENVEFGDLDYCFMPRAFPTNASVAKASS